MDKATRGTKPSKGDDSETLEDMASSYEPTTSIGSVYQESRSETWNPKTGAFNLSIGWVYI